MLVLVAGVGIEPPPAVTANVTLVPGTALPCASVTVTSNGDSTRVSEGREV